MQHFLPIFIDKGNVSVQQRRRHPVRTTYGRLCCIGLSWLSLALPAPYPNEDEEVMGMTGISWRLAEQSGAHRCHLFLYTSICAH